MGKLTLSRLFRSREFLFFFLRVKKLRIYKYWRGSRVEEENNYRDILCNRTIFKKLDIVKKKKRIKQNCMRMNENIDSHIKRNIF